MLFGERVDVDCESRTERSGMQSFGMLKLVVHIVTTGLKRAKSKRRYGGCWNAYLTRGRYALSSAWSVRHIVRYLRYHAGGSKYQFLANLFGFLSLQEVDRVMSR
jgi:hypothetical protein